MNKFFPLLLDLNGRWEFRLCKGGSWLPAQVPGCVHTDLMRNGLIPDPFFGRNELGLEWIERTDFEYRREFIVTPELLHLRAVDLVADGLDTLAVISINNTIIAKTENMFIGYRFNVKRLLKPGVNCISIRFNNPMAYLKNKRGYPWFDQPNDPVGGAAGIRKMQSSFGWDWAPRLPTCGIYRSIRIEARSAPRIAHVLVRQRHGANSVAVRCLPEAIGMRKNLSWQFKLSLDNTIVDQSTKPALAVTQPRLWWPSGSGPQPLYDLQVDLIDHGAAVDTWKRRIGLRTIKLDRQKDKWGQSFRFLVNNEPIYAKGASWAPAHSFPAMADRKAYCGLIQSAAEANFNMLRVWGGGLYEHDDFYDLCDEYGIMIWHDFMFSCSLYPRDEHFIRLVADEAECQTRRLAHHACMALWCGSNELEYYYRDILSDIRKKKAYECIFYDILPKAIKKNSPGMSYWPSSPHNPAGYEKGPNSESAGDCHFWEVWHERKPPEAAQRHNYRFWSEFGMQSYCSIDTARRFAHTDALNVLGPAMENHQKHPQGNAIIMQYISRRFRFPKDFQALSYLSQVNQAYCIKVMVEHQRGLMPRTMGSLYWQLNDCWPAFSWSSIDFGGQWKGLHYAARRFFAPALITFRLIGEEIVGKINRRVSTISGVELKTVYDGRKNLRARLSWDLFAIDTGKVVLRSEKTVTLRPNEAIIQKSLDLTGVFSRFAKGNLVMRIALMRGAQLLSSNTVLFTAPRFIELTKEKIVPHIDAIGDNQFALYFKSKTFQHQASFLLPGVKYRASDNFFDLFPEIAYSVMLTIEREKPVNIAWVKKKLRLMSVADTY